MKSRQERKIDPDFFVWAHPVWWILVPYGMALIIFSGFAPDTLPSSSYLPLASLAKSLGLAYPTLMMLSASAAVAAHVIEACFAYRQATRLGIQRPTNLLWGFQVFVLGVFAFRLLRKPKSV